MSWTLQFPLKRGRETERTWLNLATWSKKQSVRGRAGMKLALITMMLLAGGETALKLSFLQTINPCEATTLILFLFILYLKKITPSVFQKKFLN